MGRQDLTGLIALAGLGYLLYKYRDIEAAIKAARSTTTYLPMMVSPLWLPPVRWKPIPGPALQITRPGTVDIRKWFGGLFG